MTIEVSLTRKGALLRAEERPLAVSLALRTALDRWKSTLPTEAQYTVHYLEHWIETGGARAVRSGARLVAALLQGASARREKVSSSTLVLSGKNWRDTMANSKPHYAYFPDVVERSSGGVHLELPWARRRDTVEQSRWLAERDWKLIPVHGLIDVAAVAKGVRRHRVVRHQCLRALKAVPESLAGLGEAISLFCGSPLLYSLVLEEAFSGLDVGQIFLTGEASTYGRALLKAMSEHAGITSEARQHGIVLPSRLDYLHSAASSRTVPLPTKMLVYDQHNAHVLSWMHANGVDVVQWDDPRLAAPEGWVRASRPSYVLFAAQPVPDDVLAQTLKRAGTLAREEGLPLVVRLHPRMRERATRGIIPREFEILTGGSLSEQLSRASRVVTLYSTLAYEAMVLGIPVTLIAKYPESIGAAFPSDPLIEVLEW
jgi:hypothetical protein